MLPVSFNDIKKYFLSLQRKDVLHFLLSFLLALLFWLLNALANNYNSTLVFNLKYYNEPQGKVVLNSSELPRELQININGLGREIVWYSLATYLRVIELDYEQMTTISKDGRSGVINANELFKVVSKKLNANINILNVEPSNINITF